MPAGKKKVLLILNTINDYRVETYNIINEKYDLTVAYNISDKTQNECNFSKYKFKTHKLGPFHIFGRDFWRQTGKYDAVITSFDIHNLEFAIVPFVHRKFKLLTWSIGLRCSYTRPYDVGRRHELLDRLAYRILSAADANIFYMEKAKEFWESTSLDMSKVFIAPNTTSIAPVSPSENRGSILFVGTLYKNKGVDKLIASFAEAVKGLDSLDKDISLDIVGDGEERDSLERLANALGIKDKVIFHGAIHDEAKLARIFSNAILCVSPTQAGLTVPKSMGYGVPVVTRKDAITGGEIYHITPGVNGIVYENDNELASILRDAITNPTKLTEMSANAKDYYQNHARPYHQAQGVISALQHAFGTHE